MTILVCIFIHGGRHFFQQLVPPLPISRGDEQQQQQQQKKCKFQEKAVALLLCRATARDELSSPRHDKHVGRSGPSWLPLLHLKTVGPRPTAGWPASAPIYLYSQDKYVADGSERSMRESQLTKTAPCVAQAAGQCHKKQPRVNHLEND